MCCGIISLSYGFLYFFFIIINCNKANDFQIVFFFLFVILVLYLCLYVLVNVKCYSRNASHKLNIHSKPNYVCSLLLQVLIVFKNDLRFLKKTFSNKRGWRKLLLTYRLNMSCVNLKFNCQRMWIIDFKCGWII